MKKKYAVTTFLSVCIILAVLLLFNLITSTVSGIIFALALIIFGAASKGFRTDQVTPDEEKSRR